MKLKFPSGNTATLVEHSRIVVDHFGAAYTALGEDGSPDFLLERGTLVEHPRVPGEWLTPNDYMRALDEERGVIPPSPALGAPDPLKTLTTRVSRLEALVAALTKPAVADESLDNVEGMTALSPLERLWVRTTMVRPTSPPVVCKACGAYAKFHSIERRFMLGSDSIVVDVVSMSGGAVCNSHMFTKTELEAFSGFPSHGEVPPAPPVEKPERDPVALKTLRESLTRGYLDLEKAP